MLNQLIKHTEKTKFFAKGEMLQSEGQESSKIFYVKNGLLRSYTIDSKGKEHIYMFASEGWIASDLESQAFNSRTVLFIEAIEDSEVYVLDMPNFSPSSKKFEDYPALLNTLIKRIGVMQRRILSQMSSSASERYESFLLLYPQLPNRVPQKMIASYLGITPEALSKIRKRVAKES